MTDWHENARFHIFTDYDVFVEDSGHYLLVENQAFNYHGDYVCCEYQQGRNLDGTMFYMQGEHCGADNEYIVKLQKAPWDIARDVILRSLESWQQREEQFESDEYEDDDDCGISGLIEDAIWYLKRANEGETFRYMD